MSEESISIPRERIEPVAKEAASANKTVAGVLGFIGGIFVLAAVTMPGKESGGETDAVGAIIGTLIFVAIFGAFMLKFIRNARAATMAALAATSQTMEYTFTLSDRWVMVADSAGVPQPQRSFKVSRKLRKMLVAFPRATVVDKD
jgi:hypothetical protein